MSGMSSGMNEDVLFLAWISVCHNAQGSSVDGTSLLLMPHKCVASDSI